MEAVFRKGDQSPGWQEGQLWQHESFDHLVRGAGSMEGFVRYIRENPVKAGLRAGEYCLRAWSKLM